MGESSPQHFRAFANDGDSSIGEIFARIVCDSLVKKLLLYGFGYEFAKALTSRFLLSLLYFMGADPETQLRTIATFRQ